jgi:ATP-dependent Lhr-like helicase
LGLQRSGIIAQGKETLLFPWVGSVKRDTLVLALESRELKAHSYGPTVEVAAGETDVRTVLKQMASSPPPDGPVLARAVHNKVVEKFDWALDEDLLCRAWMGGRIDASSVPLMAQFLVQ